MGIIEAKLNEFELESGQEYTIEYNENDEIHIHIGNLRISMTPEEFIEFVDSVSNAHTELSGIKQGDHEIR